MDYAREHIERKIGIRLQGDTKDTGEHTEYTVAGSLPYDQLMELCEDLLVSSIKAEGGNLVIVIRKSNKGAFTNIDPAEYRGNDYGEDEA